jgi:nucleotide-binding universal stress UspA family protein
MLKRIMVATDGSEAAANGARYAVALARKYTACIQAIHVSDVKLLEGPFLQDLSASLGTTPYINYQGNIAMILEERGRAALDEVEEACKEAGIECETTLVTGIIARSIVEHSELADLIILGRGGEHSAWLEGLIGSTTEAVVRRAHQPVLVTAEESPGSERFVMAYDGTSHAKHALKSAATIAKDWGMACHLLTIGPDSTESLLEEARNYLQPFEIDAKYERREGDPGESIVAFAREVGADMIVMGAYGHSKVREFVVGSTTTYTLSHAHCPVFLHR